MFLTYADMGHGDMCNRFLGLENSMGMMMFKVVISMGIFDVVLSYPHWLWIDGTGCNQWG